MKAGKKILSVFLSVLLVFSAFSMLGTVASAVDSPPDGYTPLPTADSVDLADLAFWFDLEGYRAEFLAAITPGSEYYEYYDQFEALLSDSELFLSDDLENIKIFIPVGGITDDFSSGSYEYRTFLHRHIDLTGFSLLPTADSDALSPGDYYFDLSGYAEANSMPVESLEALYQFYINLDGSVLRIVSGYNSADCTADNDASDIYAFLCQHADPFENFILLPAYDHDGLADGEYWFDIDMLIEMQTAGLEEGSEAYNDIVDFYTAAYIYLSDDHQTISFVLSGDEYREESFLLSEDPEVFSCLSTHVSTAGNFFLLPKADSDELENGAYWFDIAALIAFEMEEIDPDDPSYEEAYAELSAMYAEMVFYLSNDHQTLRMYADDSGAFYDIDLTSEEGAYYQSFLHQHEGDPTAGYVPLPTADSDALGEGDKWLDLGNFVLYLTYFAGMTSEQIASYQNSTYYINEDGSSILIFDGESYEADSSSTLLMFVHDHGYNPSGDYLPLPTADSDALADGDYYLDLAGFAEAEGESAEMIETLYQFFVSPDGSVLRVLLLGGAYSIDGTADNDPSGFYAYLCQHEAAADPLPGFTLLPTADSLSLADGAFWFDLNGLRDAELAGVDPADPQYAEYVAFYENTTVYLSDDGTTIRFITGESVLDVTEETNALIFSFLHQHVGTAEHFTHLPTADSDALNNGDYWFDLNGMRDLELAGLDPDSPEYAQGYAYYENTSLYLSNDGTAIRYINGEAFGDVVRGDETTAMWFFFLNQHGVDPNAGFTPLPGADSDELNDGDYWYDTAAMKDYLLRTLDPSDENFDGMLRLHTYLYSNLTAYLSNDGNTLRIEYPGTRTDYALNEQGESAELLFTHNFFQTLPLADSAALADGDYWLDVAALAKSVNEPVSAFDAFSFSFNAEREILRIASPSEGIFYTIRGEAIGDLYLPFVRPHGFFVPLPTADSDALTDDQYYFALEDVLALLAQTEGAEDEMAFLQSAEYFISSDATILRFVIEGIPFDFVRGDEAGSLYFEFIYPHHYFIELPKADSDALTDGDYWFDFDNYSAIMLMNAADEEAAAQMEALLATMEIYITADNEYLMIRLGNDMIKTSIEEPDPDGGIFVTFLRQHGVDPNEGFHLLPQSTDGLDIDAIWYDVESFCADMEMDAEEFAALGFAFYLSDDGETLRVIQFGTPIDITAETDDDGFLNYVKKNHVDADDDYYCDGCGEYLGIVITNDETDTTILAEPGVLDEGVELVVEDDVDVDDADSIVISDGDLTLENVNYVAYEITLEDENGDPVQPEGEVTVRILLPNGFNPEKIKVFYIDDEGNATDMEAYVEDGYVYFTTDHFSTYVLVDETCLHKSTEVRNAVEGNCHVEGYTGDTYCLICGEKIAEGENTGFVADNHDGGTKLRDAVAATCHTKGYTGDTYCLGCDRKIADGAETDFDANNHDGETEVRGAVAATCHTKGYTGDTYCLGCNQKIADGEETDFDAANHDGETEVRGSVAATCHTKGYTGDTYCLGCNQKITDGAETDFDAANHDGETEVRNVVIGNCHVDGYTGDTYCLGCNQKIADGENTGKVPSSHDALREVEETASSCTEHGYTAGVFCDGCGNWISGHEEQALAAHTLGDWVEEIAADCTNAGTRGHYTCAICQNNFDADEAPLDSVTIPANGHTWSEWETVKEATETEEGEKTRQCSVCGETETEVIPANGKPISFWDRLVTFIYKIISFFRNMIQIFKSIG